MNIIAADIVSCFNPSAIGTKVVDSTAFMAALETAIETHDRSQDRVQGQMFVALASPEAYLSAGVGRRTADPNDYVCREHRGQVAAYLRRGLAANVEGAAAIVYSKSAYVADPEVTPEEAARVAGADFVLVAVLAFAGPKAPLSPHRFTANLAGGNREAAVWSADEIRTKAAEVAAYDAEWCVVAD